MSNSKHSDNASVPLDEMLRRLKQKGSSDENERELVTREDGTQAMKVRRRKRRSHQPHKEDQKKKQKRFIVGVIFFIAFAIATGVAFFVFLIKNNSDSALKGAIATIEEETKGVVKLDGLSIRPTSVTAGQFYLDGGPNSFIRSISATKINGDKSLLSFFTGQLAGRNLSAESGSVHLTMPKGALLGAEVGTFGKQLDFESYGISAGVFRVGEHEPFPLELKGASITAMTRPGGLGVSFGTGKLRLLDLPAYELTSGYAEFEGDVLNLKNVRIRTESKGLIIVPEDQLVMENGMRSETSFALREVQLNELGLGQLEAILIGTISCEANATASFDFGESTRVDLAIPFSAGDLKIKNLPMFYRLSDAFERINVQHRFGESSEVSGIITKTEDGITVQDLRLVEIGRLAVLGALEISPEGGLKGKLRVGIGERISEDSLGRPIIPGLGPKEEGYRWVDVTVGGTLQQPEDNFERVISGAGESEVAPPSPDSSGDAAVDELFQGLDD